MKWVQVNDLALTHVFELVGDIETVKRKLRNIFGPDVEIETFGDMED